MTEVTLPDTHWFDDEGHRLLALVGRAVHPDGGFGYLDDASELDPSRPVATWITSRMTHVAALGALHGSGEAQDLVDVGVGALTGPLRDAEHGGWFSDTSRPDLKEAYAHAFVVLAAASATGAGHPDGQALLDEALAVLDQRFWDERAGLSVDEWDAAWTRLDDYRGINANMHTVEALLAAADVTGDAGLRERAARITERVVHGFAREHDWRLPEHFDTAWRPLLDYNVDEPGHPFRPYGVTIGHLLEWSRLALAVRTAQGDAAADWLLPDAISLYDAGVRRGWAVDGADGFVYTTDFADRPVVRERMHWVLAEATATAAVLHRATGEQRYVDDGARWWDYARTHLIDPTDGSWVHELGPDNQPSATVWPGRPDIYHAYQASVLPLLPDAASFVGAASPRW